MSLGIYVICLLNIFLSNHNSYRGLLPHIHNSELVSVGDAVDGKLQLETICFGVIALCNGTIQLYCLFWKGNIKVLYVNSPTSIWLHRLREAVFSALGLQYSSNAGETH